MGAGEALIETLDMHSNCLSLLATAVEDYTIRTGSCHR